VRFVAKEFQTGLATESRARWHIAKLLELQQRIGRGLHLCVIGGRRHMAKMMRLDGFTIVDSSPFLHAVHRQILTRPNGRWELARMPKGEMLDGRLAEILEVYRQGIKENAIVLRSKPVQTSNLRIAVGSSLNATPENRVPENQRDLWPDLWLKETA
jgi:hypothetical protein